MHFANYVGDVPNKLRRVHDKLVVYVHQSRNFRRISLEEERLAGMLYPEWQLFMLQEHRLRLLSGALTSLAHCAVET